MSESRSAPEIDLNELAERLTLEGMPTQKVVASEAGVSQPTVSRAMRGQIKGASKGARKLWKYTSERMRVLREPPVGRPMARPGASPPSARQRSASRAGPAKGLNMRDEARQRAAPLPRQRAETVVSGTDQGREQLAEAAIAGLRDYLADAFDPLLVIEQLAVLRRAQDPARRRRSKTISEQGTD
jgi:transcriptional regulator with XRE-family HTH domain